MSRRGPGESNRLIISGKPRVPVPINIEDAIELDCGCGCSSGDCLTAECDGQDMEEEWEVFQFPFCCTRVRNRQAGLMKYKGDCTWESETFDCGDFETKLTLTIDSEWVNLESQQEDEIIRWRKRRDEWSPNCTNVMKLDTSEGRPDCDVPCNICVRLPGHGGCSFVEEPDSFSSECDNCRKNDEGVRLRAFAYEFRLFEGATECGFDEVIRLEMDHEFDCDWVSGLGSWRLRVSRCFTSLTLTSSSFTGQRTLIRYSKRISNINCTRTISLQLDKDATTIDCADSLPESICLIPRPFVPGPVPPCPECAPDTMIVSGNFSGMEVNPPRPPRGVDIEIDFDCSFPNSFTCHRFRPTSCSYRSQTLEKTYQNPSREDHFGNPIWDTHSAIRSETTVSASPFNSNGPSVRFFKMFYSVTGFHDGWWPPPRFFRYFQEIHYRAFPEGEQLPPFRYYWVVWDDLGTDSWIEASEDPNEFNYPWFLRRRTFDQIRFHPRHTIFSVIASDLEWDCEDDLLLHLVLDQRSDEGYNHKCINAPEIITMSRGN